MHVQSLPTFLALIASLSVSTSHAAPHDDAPSVAPIHAETGAWSLGGSLTFGGGLGALSTIGGLGALGGVSEVGVEPGVTLERRLTDHWWLTVGASLTLQEVDTGAGALAGAGSVGARFVLDPSARIRLAPRASVYARGGATDYVTTVDGVRTTLSFDSRHLGVALGLDVELAVVEGFALRLDLTIASADWSTVARDDGSTATTTDAFTITMLSRPTLSAVFTF